MKHNATEGQLISKVTLSDGQNVAIRFDTYDDPYKNLVFAILVRAGLDAQEVKSALTLRRGAYDDIKQDAKDFLSSDYAKQMLDFLRS